MGGSSEGGRGEVMGDVLRGADRAVEWSSKMATAARVRARDRCKDSNIDVRWMRKGGLKAIVVVDSLDAAADAVEDQGKVLLDQNGGVYLIGILQK